MINAFHPTIYKVHQGKAHLSSISLEPRRALAHSRYQILEEMKGRLEGRKEEERKSTELGLARSKVFARLNVDRKEKPFLVGRVGWRTRNYFPGPEGT